MGGRSICRSLALALSIAIRRRIRSRPLTPLKHEIRSLSRMHSRMSAACSSRDGGGSAPLPWQRSHFFAHQGQPTQPEPLHFSQ